ncbi:MAG TPA: putative nucleotidyltransferase substrate binding domain-containing protein [Lapillicoccus sp.]|nr:putative nucleotidyltransferase substrate binding domain-containing protein [Lapillicoccus sp.]
MSTVVPGTDLASFLAAYPPFDRLDDTARTTLAGAARVERYAPGELVLDAFAAASEEVFVVVSGRVDLWDDRSRVAGAPDEVLGPGGVFGFSAMLTESSVGPRAVAGEPSTVARIPESAAGPVFASRHGARFLAERLAAAPPAVESAPTYSTVDELVRRAPLIVAPDTTVADVARAMTEQELPCAVVDRGVDGFGLVTDARLRERVLVGGMPASAPVRDVMADAPTVSSGSSAAEALIQLFDRDAEFLLVTDAAGGLRGVVAPRDFAVSPTTAGVSLHEQLRRAATTDELVDRAHRAPAVLEDLLSRGLATGRVISVYSSIVDALTRRAIGLVFDRHPELDVDAFTWMSLGSNGRREAVLSSDVDCAVAFRDGIDPAVIPAYRAVFAEVEEVLSRAGVRGDRHGATASHPTFARTNAEWRAAAEQWLAAPEANNGAMMTSLLVDGRPIHGDPGLPAVTAVFSDLRRHPGTMRLLLEESLSSRARMRSLRDRLSRRPETFYVKAHAVLPVVNLARWGALAVGSPALPTVDRLRAAGGTEMLPTDRADTLVEVFRLLQRLRLRYQLLQRQAGDRPSDLLTVDRLSSIDRSLVAEAVREIASIQRRMTNVAHFLPAQGWVGAERR